MFVASETNRILVGHASDGASVEITGHIPEGAQAVITPVTLTREQMIAFYGEELVDAVDDLVVYDICIMVDGEEWEPDKDVSVVIHSPVIETKESNEEVTVTHLDEEAETAEKVETEVTEEGDITFATDSFSLWGLYTYTVDYYLNDNEYHQPGNTSMLLSELFEHLLVEIPTYEVESVEFTDYTLLQIDYLAEEEDFLITALKPFTTHEILTVYLKDGSVFTIEVEDRLYADYTYEDSQLEPFIGSFSYGPGHYDIFGGGNGIASVTDPQVDAWWKGNWGGNSYWNQDWTGTEHGTKVTLKKLKGAAVGKDQNEHDLVPESNKFKSGSSAMITWNGTLEQAFLSFGFLYYYNTSAPTYAVWDLTLYAPDGASTPIVITADNTQTNDPRPDPEGGSATTAWRILSFDATAFVGAHGPGKYTMILELYPCAGHTDINSYISDMGFSIYGVCYNSNRPVSAVAGIVDEKLISGSTGSGNYGIVTAEAFFSEHIAPRGNGKAWFNCQGGETKDGQVDQDYLEVKASNGDYLTLGSWNAELTSEGDIPIEGWHFDDIAAPNHNQTAPDGYTNFNNCFSFGLGSFSGLDEPSVIGVRKRQAGGNDCFGSIMLLVEVMPAAGVVEVLKFLNFSGNGVAPSLPQHGSERDLTFTVTNLPGDNAPLPTNTTSTVRFAPGTQSGESLTLQLGTFNFGTELPGGVDEYTFQYNVRETTTETGGAWIFDDRTLVLSIKVKYDNDKNSFEIVDYWWTDPTGQGPNWFINDYVLPTALEVKKVDMSEDHKPVSGAKFMLYKDADCTTPADVFTDAARTIALTAANPPVTGTDGKVRFYGIEKEDSPYYLKEYSAPEGYILDGTVVKISYNETDDTWEATPDSGITTYPEPNTDLGVISLTRENNEYVSAYANKAWVNADGSTTAPQGATVEFTLYADDTATTYKVTLDGKADTPARSSTRSPRRRRTRATRRARLTRWPRARRSRTRRRRWTLKSRRPGHLRCSSSLIA